MEKLKKYMSDRGIKFTYLIKETGYHRGHVSRVFNGHTNNSPHFKKLVQLALQKLLDIKWQEHEKERKQLEAEQSLLDEALEDL